MICLVILACVLVKTESLPRNTSYVRMGRTATLNCPFDPVKTWVRGIQNRKLVSLTNYREFNPTLSFVKRLAVSEKYSLIIKNVTSLDFKVYRCTGNNISTRKLDTYDIQLKQAIDPSNIRILEETEHHRVIGVIGQAISITCTVTSGEPEETLIIKDDDGRDIVKGGPGSINFQLNPDHNDDGKIFTCFVFSCDEQILSYTVELQLIYKPNITVQAYPSKTIIEGNLFKLTCNDEEGDTNGILQYKWLHNGKYLKHSLKVMQLNVTTQKDNGNYTCIAENEAGEESYTIEITVLSPPRMPKITSLERTPYAILVKWKPGFDGGLRATYQIEYRKVTEITWDMINTKENIRNTFFIADPNTDYLVKMKALNKIGHSSFTKEHTVFTEEFINYHTGSQKFIAIFVMLSFLFTMAAVVGLRYSVKNRRCFGRYKDRKTPSQRREEVSVILGHYDEINSMYYNPINNTISSQNHRNIVELGIQQLSNMTDNIERDDTESSSYQSIAPYTVRQVEYSQKNYSARSSTAESYLIPCRMSDMSDNSETNIKSVQRYETLNFSAKNENMYTTCNVTDT